jgi:nifR3 family TIM-barrel protein
MMGRMASTVVDAADLPVTAKTRLGWDDSTIKIREVALMMQDIGIKALTVHARTRSQKYKGEARYEWLKYVKETPGLHIPIIGNGDITSPEVAKQVFDETGVDGIMVGRGAIGDPWIFKRIKVYLETGELIPEPTWEERLELCCKHLELSVEHHGLRYGVIIMKKHYGNYFKGIPHAKGLRLEIMELDDPQEIVEKIMNFQPVSQFAVV